MQFVDGDPFLFDRADILRFQVVGTEDGTPNSSHVLAHPDLACRLDTLQGKRRDEDFRSTFNHQHLNFGTCFFPPNVDVRSNDMIRFTTRNGERWQVHSVERAINGTEIHHLEVSCKFVEGVD